MKLPRQVANYRKLNLQIKSTSLYKSTRGSNTILPKDIPSFQCFNSDDGEISVFFISIKIEI